MIVDTVDRQTIRAAVELGSHAPSLHNSQPWRWRLDGRNLLLQADLRRWLPATDADGRDLVVSCGAALHHTRVALAASGVHAAVHRIPDPQRADDLAALELSPRRRRRAHRDDPSPPYRPAPLLDLGRPGVHAGRARPTGLGAGRVVPRDHRPGPPRVDINAA